MRHVRILVLCLVAVVAASAMTLSVASTAFAKGKCVEYESSEGEKICETPAEHSKWQSFANCPFGAPPVSEEYGSLAICVGGESFYQEKETWESKAQQEAWEASHGPAPELKSYFTAGRVTVPLKMPITLRGGFEINENTGEIVWIAARGAATIQPVPQKSISITKGVDKALLSPSELERYLYNVRAKQTATTATVELAGPAEQIHLDLNNQLEETGTAFVFPVKVKLSNPFLGEDCYVGSTEHPIDVPFTTGQDGELHGKAGVLTSQGAGSMLVLWSDTLVSSSFSSPGVENCGVEGGADEAVDSALGLPAATGNTSVLDGVLKLAGAEEAESWLR